MTTAITHAHSGTDLIATAVGSLTFQGYGEGARLLDELFAKLGAAPTQRIVFDLSAVDIIDSHWLGLLIRVLKRSEEHKVGVVLRGARPGVRRVMDLVQFGRLFTIEA
jgi:anti-anti-sigma factor